MFFRLGAGGLLVDVSGADAQQSAESIGLASFPSSLIQTTKVIE
jgi:hypothetical protein